MEYGVNLKKFTKYFFMHEEFEGLVCFFNGISYFMGYLISKTSP